MKSIHLILVLLLGSTLLSAQTTNAKFKIANKIHLEGDGGWDYLYSDDQAGRLYVSHGTMVQVIDEAKGELIGTISETPGVHGIAIASDLNKGYISCGRDTSVVVFDIKTLKVISRITVTGLNPDAILFDPFSKKVFVYNGRSNDATVIDALTDKVVATIPLEGKPEFSATDGKGKVFVNIEDVSKLCQINATTLKVEKVWPLAPGEEPTGLAFDAKTKRLFSACGNEMMIVIDAETGNIVAKVPTGKGVDGTTFDPELGFIYVANGEGTMTVIKEVNKDEFKVIETFPTQSSARTITSNKITHHIYLSAADYETIPQDANTRARRKIIPNSFVILDIEPMK